MQPVWVDLPQFSDDGTLTVLTELGSRLPNGLNRVFWISGVSANGWRADHAHRECSQLHVCFTGRVIAHVTDGEDEIVYELSPNGRALLIPPMFWAKFQFQSPETVLGVFCDIDYDSDEYITDWNQFMAQCAKRGN